ncbi:MAG: hypothetical protein NVSMB22_20170 [Chloroflexota bacterium]
MSVAFTDRSPFSGPDYPGEGVDNRYSVHRTDIAPLSLGYTGTRAVRLYLEADTPRQCESVGTDQCSGTRTTIGGGIVPPESGGLA